VFPSDIPMSSNNCATVFLFDWDDTLMASTHLEKPCDVNIEISYMLSEIDARTSRVLMAALATPHARVVILTNAEESWVWASAKHMPRVDALLQSGRILVVSAYQPFEERVGEPRREAEYRRFLHTQSSSEWKDGAVRRLAVHFKRSLIRMKPTSLQVVAVGDREHDLEAGHTLAKLLSSIVSTTSVKAIKMQSAPGIRELEGELHLLGNMLPSIISKMGDLKCSMGRKPEAKTQCDSVSVLPESKRKIEQTVVETSEQESDEDSHVAVQKRTRIASSVLREEEAPIVDGSFPLLKDVQKLQKRKVPKFLEDRKPITSKVVAKRKRERRLSKQMVGSMA